MIFANASKGSEADTEIRGTAELFGNRFGSSLFGGSLILPNLLKELARDVQDARVPWRLWTAKTGLGRIRTADHLVRSRTAKIQTLT